MGLKIDRNKSIKFKQVIFKTGWESILNLLFEISFCSMLPLLMIYLTYKSYDKIGLIGLIIIFSFISLYLLSWFLLGKLYIVKLHGRKENRDFLVETFAFAFPELPIKDNGINAIVAKKISNFSGTGKCLTILFDEENAYINLTSLARFEARSFLYSITNYYKIKEVINDYELFSNGN